MKITFNSDENIVKAIELGQAPELLLKRMQELEKDKKSLEAELKKEEKDGRTVFTNGIPTRETDKPGKTPKGPGDTTRIEDYKTPLGVEIMINHVGDCFD